MSEFISGQTQWVDSGGKPVVNGFIYIGVAGLDPVLNPETIFSDRALTVALANPQRTDANGRSVNKIWIPGRYSLKIEDSANAQIYQELDNGEEVGAKTIPLTNVQGINAITAEASPAITALTDKTQFVLQIVLENTADAVTLAIDATGAKSIKRNFNLDVGKGKFQVSQTVIVIYNLANDNYEWVNNNQSVILDNQVGIASAATVDLALSDGNSVSVTGHDGPIASLGTVLAGAVFKLIYAGSTPVIITSSSIASPTNILCDAVHGLTSGDIVLIEGHSGSIPDINGHHIVTVVDILNYTIPVNVTTGGTGGTSTGVPSMTHNATSMILTGANDRSFNPGDTQEVISLGSGNWREFNYQPIEGNTPTGIRAPFEGLVAPQGWVMCKGGTIGSPTSGATERANPDTEALFTLIWNSMADAQRAVSSGRGASAAADFASNKNIALADMRGKMTVGTGGTAPAIHGDNGGEETHTDITSEMPAHIHMQNRHSVTFGGLGPAGPTSGATAIIVDDKVTDSTGGDGAHENMPPWDSANWIIKL